MVEIVLGGSACCDGSSSPPVVPAGLVFLDTIALLRAATISPTSDSAVMVGGYYTKNDGGGGLYIWSPASTATDNGGTVINPTGNIGTGRWILQLYGQTPSTRQFGAKINGTDDDTAAINTALANTSDLISPPGTSYVAGTLAMLRIGQKFRGVSPNDNDAGSVLMFGPGAADCIMMGNLSGVPNANYEGQQLYDLDLDCSQRLGLTGHPNGVAVPDSTITCCAVSIYNGTRTQIKRLNIVNAWNGIFNYASDFVDLDSISFSGTRGDFNELHCGSSTNTGTAATGNCINHSAAPDVTHTTSANISIGTVIPMTSTAGMYTGWVAFVPVVGFCHITAVNPGVSITIDQNITGLIAAGSSITATNQCIALWISSYFSTYQGKILRNNTVSCILQVDDPVNSGTSAPSNVQIYSMGGGSLGYGQKINLVAGSDISLVSCFCHGAGSDVQSDGQGMMIGPNVSKVRLTGCEIDGHYRDGILIQGTQVQISNCTISENGQIGAQQLPGIFVDSNANSILISNSHIGGFNPFGGGNQSYGIQTNGNFPTGLIVDGCDLRSNGLGAVSDPTAMVLGANLGLSHGGEFDHFAQYFLSWATQSKPAAVSAYNTLIYGLRAAGIWGICDILLVMAAVDEPTALINLRRPFQSPQLPSADTQGTVNFAQYGGLTGDGTSGYIDLDVGPNALANYSLNSASIYYWSGTNQALDAAFDVQDSNSSQVVLNGRGTAGSLQTWANATTNGNDTVADSLGSYGWSRGSSASYNAHKNGSLLSTHNIASGAVPTGDVVLLGKAPNFSSRQCRAFFMGGHLTDAQVASLNTLVNAYLASV